VNRIAICPTNRDLILVATNDGIFRSANRGSTFTLVQTGKTYDLQFHPTDPLKAVAGRSNGVTMRTADGGLSWLSSTGSTGQRVEVRYYRSNPEIVYSAISSNGRIRVYRSDNGGATFVLRTSGNGASTYVNYNTGFWVDPTNSQRMILGGVNLYRSSDGGVTLNSAYSNVHPDHHAIVEHPNFDGVATHGPRRGLPLTSGSFFVSSFASAFRLAGAIAAALMSFTFRDRSRSLPSASMRPGFSLPAGP
jgi:hypothetical protein